MSLRVRRLGIGFLFIGAGLLPLGCCEDTTRPDDRPSGIRSIDINAVPGMSVTDEETQLHFAFPQGGSGVLDIGRLDEAPARPFEGGAGYRLAFRGSEPVQLLLTEETNGYLFLLGYGTPPGSRSEGRRTGWFALPPEATHDDTTQAFRILSTPDPASDSLAYYWVIRFPAGSPTALQFTDAIAAANGMLAAFDDSLAAVFATIDGARTPAQLPPRFYPDGRYYSGFAPACDGDNGCAQPMIGIGLAPTNSQIAHEIGHYLTQLLTGDAIYREFEARMIAEPGIGARYETRTGLVEDYAHYLGYLLTGLIDGAGDPNGPADFFHLDPAPPASVDTPSLEGYGVLFLEALARRDPVFVNIRNEPVDVVPAGLSRATLLGILARGPLNMNELRTMAADELASAGMADRLAPLAAASGWMPHINGRVVSRTWTVLPGAEILAVVAADGREFTATADPAISGEFGWYDLPAVFPGPQILRVTVDQETFDFPFEVAWEHPTDQVLRAADHFLWPDLSTLNTIGIALSLGFNTAPGDTVTPSIWVGNCDFSCHDTLGVFEMDRVYVDEPVVFEAPPQPAWSLDTLGVSYSLATGDVIEFVLEGHQIESGSSLRLIGRAGLRATITGARHVQFGYLKNVPDEEVNEVFDVTLTTPGGFTYTNEDLAPDGHLIVIKAEYT